jgi:hypothetical protein
MSAPNQPSKSKEYEEAELRKMKAEARLAEWQNTRLGRSTRYTVIITALAIVVTGAWTVYIALEEKEKERAQRQREQSHEVESRIYAATEKLLNFNNEGPPPPGQAKFLLDQLQTDIGKLPNLDEAGVAERKRRISTQMVAVFKGGEFDCKKNRHLDFEMEALKWSDYQETLKQETADNQYILNKYLRALKSLHDEDPQFVETAIQDKKRIIHLRVKPRNEATPILLEKLTLGYHLHCNLLTDSPDRTDYNKALCQFYRVTNNRGLTAAALGLDGLDSCD